MLFLTLVGLFFFSSAYVNAYDGILGCGGFIKSHVPIDFSKVEIKLYTKQGILKDRTNCAPNNGYYFIPLYDKGDYVLQLEPPPGWSFTPTKINLNVDGKSDLCSQGKDINFAFKGFGITGRVETIGHPDGPEGIPVELKSKDDVRNTVTGKNGNFFFTPVYPGQYTVSITHPRWVIKKQSVSVTVTEGNTELPGNSLVIGGYDVTGYIKSNDDPVADVNIMLYSDNKNKVAAIEGCEKKVPIGFTGDSKFLCHVTSMPGGKFVFPCIPPGKYYIVPFYKSHQIFFNPKKIELTVESDSIEISEVFQITGFKLTGRVLQSQGGKPLEKAIIFLNDQEQAITNKDGTYTLQSIKSGKYQLKVEATDVGFDVIDVKVNPSVLTLPDIYPTVFKVCGQVISDKPQVVKIAKADSTQQFTIVTEKQTGSFCQFLPIGKYSVHVAVNEQDSSKGLQFFPITHTIEVNSKPLTGITFSQLKAKLSGSVKCINAADCNGIYVKLNPLIGEVGQEDQMLTVELKNGKYVFEDVRPGSYDVSLSATRFCWVAETQKIVVTDAKFDIPPFVQSGFTVVFQSSHNIQVSYKIPGQTKEVKTDIQKTNTVHCLPKPGTYTFAFSGCHTFETDAAVYNTDSASNEIQIVAKKHRHVVQIDSAKDDKPVYITVNLNGVKSKEGPLKHNGNGYFLELMLGYGENVILVPQSETLYFEPPISSLTGLDDCSSLINKFKAVKGKVFKGRVIPPLAGVEIVVESETSDTLTEVTDEQGRYQFAPLDAFKKYKITATKDSYVLTGPLENGDFKAHKLAEIVVQVLDEVNNVPLQGALLSLSGGESYRSNLQTNEHGKITFHSLSPSEYFLRPMLKEYHFEPNSKIINVKEGATVNVQLKGKRVAYSAFGKVTSLNKEPEEKMIVVASGINNCTQYSEEATSEVNGNFRIRGLIPYCAYEITIKGAVDEKEIVERSAPRMIPVNKVTSDIKNMDFVVFRPAPNTDVIVKVYSSSVEHYKNLRIKISRETAPSALIHTMKLDPAYYKMSDDYNYGVVMHVPSVPYDGKTYSVQLESTLSHHNTLKPTIQYFTANSSFKAVTLEFKVKSSATEQQIKQTSIWTLAFIFASLLAVYKADLLAQFAKERSINLNIAGRLPSLRNKSPTRDYVIDNNEINQLVENIKRKQKPRRV